jgi:hypothetical protein
MADDLQSLSDWLKEEPKRAIAPLHTTVQSIVGTTFSRLRQATPVLSGELQSSLAIVNDDKGEIKYGEEAVTLLDGWKPDDLVAIISDLPYSAPIYLEGHSADKFPVGKLDTIIEDGLNLGELKVKIEE